MKTLDEVIEAIEYCSTHYWCTDCPYSREDICYGTDALHYLKAYKEDRNDLTALRAYWAEMHKDVRKKAEVKNENVG